jgi:sigma-B regulation protein RsbU (phosphoserine phosphatase)
MTSRVNALPVEAVPRRRVQRDAWTSRAIDTNDFEAYKLGIIHDWLRTLTLLASILVPLFFVLDILLVPTPLLPRFGVYRFTSMAVALVQLLIVRRTQPSRWSYLHGYVMSVQVGGFIALMTVSLGGFDSSYYAGLNLVIIGVNLLMPWRVIHSAVNAVLILGMYVAFNFASGQSYQANLVANNLFFLCATGILAVSINYVRYRLIQKEFSLLVTLKQARDALWGEMELAKRIQTALLPRKQQTVSGFQTAVAMLPAREVGGDYYDIIETPSGDRWIAVGDVAGHGVDSGLIMMMAQSSIMTVIKGMPSARPMDVLNIANLVLREDIRRLGSNHYMTLMVIRLDDHHMTLAGHHQDVLVYRAARGSVDTVSTRGTWLGITDQIEGFMEVRTVDLAEDDIVLLFTDGVTEGKNKAGDMYGQERLCECFARNAHLPVERILQKMLEEISQFQGEQEDDMTLILLKKTGAAALRPQA